ncbi:hypothetical protein EBZ37_12610, partial [bacterium]|nr:hypothetical protein [bacterium]
MNQVGSLRSKSTERTILITGILMMAVPGAILSANILLTDLFFASRDILSLSPIGEITLPDRIVRRKGEDESAFRPSRSGDSVFVGDTIITGKESSTRINFSDGSTLELGPESMVKIEPIRSYSFSGIRKKLRVTVQAGSVKASTSSASTPMVFESLAGTVNFVELVDECLREGVDLCGDADEIGVAKVLDA